jgi:hypothetical protein
MNELSQRTKELIKEYQRQEKFSKTENNESKIHVDEVTSRVASFYEKIRGIIDWKEEHLLKRSAIERSLKRRILPNINLTNGKLIQAEIMAEPLVLELIRSGHFPNDFINENRINVVQKIINKYIYFLNNFTPNKKDSKLQFLQWLVSIASCEIEEALTPALKERALMNYMYQSLQEKIELGEKIIKEIKNQEIKDILIYINVQKALFDLDNSIISYHLIKYKYKDWHYLNSNELEEVSKKMHEIKQEIDSYLEHPLSGKIYQVCHKYNTPYLILGEIIQDDPMKAEEKISNPINLESLIKEKYNIKIKTLKSRLRRAAFYSTLSIFLTNILALLLIEIPIANYSSYTFSTTAWMIDIFVPTFFMALLVVTIKPPPTGNLETVIMETIKITHSNQKKEKYEIKYFRKRGKMFNTVISLIYLISFFVSLGFIAFVLSKINFPPFSYIVFIVFLCLIAFAGTKIREKAKELHMNDDKETFSSIVTDFFALPIIYLGKWLTSRWKRYNIISTFFNALLDMPFSIFLEFLEQWRFFLKEKKERI